MIYIGKKKVGKVFLVAKPSLGDRPVDGDEQVIPEGFADVRDVNAEPTDILEGKTYVNSFGELKSGSIKTYKGSTTIVPTKEKQILNTQNKYIVENIEVDPIPDEYIVPSGTLEISEATWDPIDVREYETLQNTWEPEIFSSKKLTVTENGTYKASDSGVDGFHTVEVHVDEPSGDTSTPEPTLIAKEITENGTYNASDESADGYSSVTVNVEPVLQEKTATANGDVTPDEGYDGLSKVVVNVASTGGANGLQWICDNMKKLTVFNGYTGESVDEPLSGLDTSKVEDFSYCFTNNTNLTSVPELDTSSGKDFTNMFQNCDASIGWEIDLSSATTTNNMFRKSLGVKKFKNTNKINKLTSVTYMFAESSCSAIEGLDLSCVTNAQAICKSDNLLLEFVHPETSLVTNFQSAFESCTGLTTLSLNLYSCTNSSSIIAKCYKLTDIVLKNIKSSITLAGKYTSNRWGHIFTTESVIGLIKELWDYSSGTTTYSITIGTASLANVADVYVKLVDVTDEMIAEDPYIASKKPCVVCESTDEGAMTITEYATSKNWTIKTV